MERRRGETGRRDRQTRGWEGTISPGIHPSAMTIPLWQGTNCHEINRLSGLEAVQALLGTLLTPHEFVHVYCGHN